MRRELVMMTALALSLPAFVWAAEPSAQATRERESTSIHFADLGGIRDWSADGRDALYIQGRNRQWYHAELMSTCQELPFALKIGFVIEPSGDFDRFSSILVDGQECQVRSLVPSEAPPKKAKKSGKAQPES